MLLDLLKFYSFLKRLSFDFKTNVYLVIPGQGNNVLDGTSQDDLFLSAWQIGSDTYGALSAYLANNPNSTIIVTVNPDGAYHPS